MSNPGPIAADDSHFAPVALSGTPAPPPPPAEDAAGTKSLYQNAVDLLSGRPSPSPQKPPSPAKVEAKTKTLADIAAELLGGE